MRRAGRDPSSAEVIAEGAPRLLLLGTTDQFGAAIPEGIHVVPIACQSEGALEVYIEPVAPTPHLVVVGRSPMAHTLVEMAGALGWRTDLLEDGVLSTRESSSARWSWSPRRGTATKRP